MGVHFTLAARCKKASRHTKLLKGSWDLVTRVIVRVTILITPIKALITLLTKSQDPPSTSSYLHLTRSAVTGKCPNAHFFWTANVPAALRSKLGRLHPCP